MANEKIAEQQMFHDKRFNEALEEGKAEYIKKWKTDQTKLKKLIQRNGVLKKKGARIGKEMKKYKEMVMGNSKFLDELETKMTNTLYSAALAVKCPEILPHIHQAIKLKYPNAEISDMKNPK